MQTLDQGNTGGTIKYELSGTRFAGLYLLGNVWVQCFGYLQLYFIGIDKKRKFVLVSCLNRWL